MTTREEDVSLLRAFEKRYFEKRYLGVAERPLVAENAGAAAEDERGEGCDRCNDPTHI